MSQVTLADAKAHLSALVEQATQGEPVRITRRGKAIVQITRIEQPRRPVDLAALRRLTDAMPRQQTPASDWLRQVRDEERY
jgi:prevent-host-death family protein